MEEFVIGVDVGTGSVRGALINKNGSFKAIATHKLKCWNPEPDFYEQSSEDIWQATCSVVKVITKGVNLEFIKGIGFDSTCSLVAIGKNGAPVSLSKTGDENQNIIMWMDHRAIEETRTINDSGHHMLKYVGGSVSVEMQVPKLLWIKKNLEESWNKTDKFFDLPDFLTWRATGSDSRSLCSLICKWMYEASTDVRNWNEEFYYKIGLGDLISNNFHKIGAIVKEPGEPCGKGLSEKAAQELGLLPGTTVATSIIDAHAGGLGLIGSSNGLVSDIRKRLAMICGTSTCHMKISDNIIFVDGVWGPYLSAMVPGFWLNEAGQSASGKLLDFIIDSHPSSSLLYEKLGSTEMVFNYLNNILEEMALRKGTVVDSLTANIHVWPDFHGNRSPIADPSLRGMISGLDLSSNDEQLALLYLATVQALSYGTRHIIEVLQESGHEEISCILMCGGLSKNSLFVKTQANVVSKAVLIPDQSEAVLLGSGILAASAAKIYNGVLESISHMSGTAKEISPNISVNDYHERKYRVFKKMLKDQLSYKEIMKGL